MTFREQMGDFQPGQPEKEKPWKAYRWDFEINEDSTVEAASSPSVASPVREKPEGVSDEEWEHSQYEMQLEARFKDAFPVGSTIDLQSYVKELLEGDLHDIDPLTNTRNSPFHSTDLLLDGPQPTDVNSMQAIRDLVQEKKQEIERVMGPNDFEVFSKEALRVLEKSPKGEVLYADTQESGDEGDSRRFRFVTKHGQEVLFFEADCYEFGIPVVFRLETAQEIVKKEKESDERDAKARFKVSQ